MGECGNKGKTVKQDGMYNSSAKKERPTSSLRNIHKYLMHIFELFYRNETHTQVEDGDNMLSTSM